MAAASDCSLAPASAGPHIFLPLRQYVIVLLIAAALPALAQKRPAEPTADLNAFALQVASALLEEQRALAALDRRVRETRDPDAVRELEREASRVRVHAEVALLRIHAQHARLAGNDRMAERIEAAIRVLTEAAQGSS